MSTGSLPKKSSLIICAVLRIIPVRGVLRDHVFNSTTTTGFSDLDGTLLDSHSYDWQPAARLSRLHEANIPVILCSSKTSAEMLYLQKMLGLQGLPLIAENGAVIQLAEQWQDIDGFPRIISGISHGEICRF